MRNRCLSGVLVGFLLAIPAAGLARERCPQVCPDGSQPHRCVCPQEGQRGYAPPHRGGGYGYDGVRQQIAATFGVSPQQVPDGLLTAIQQGRITQGALTNSNIATDDSNPAARWNMVLESADHQVNSPANVRRYGYLPLR